MNNLVCENTDRETKAVAAVESFIAPPMTMFENQDGFVLALDMPGVAKENLEVSIENREMTVVGRRATPAFAGTVLHRESRKAHFRRAFEIDSTIDAEKISVSISQGLATISLPKAEQAKSRKITVS